MAAYNAERTISTAVQSVLNSNIPVDVYIVDDGSQIPVSTVLTPCPDSVYIIRIERNVGLPSALNIGLEKILAMPYDFLARFDADDISLPQRFERQLTYFTENSDIGVVGAWAKAIDSSSGTPLFDICPPSHHRDIVRYMRYNSAFIHPTLMFRSEVLRQLCGYNTKHLLAQDYELMSRAIRLTKCANVSEFLIKYSHDPTNESRKKRVQLLSRLEVQIANFNALDIHSSLGIGRTLILLMFPSYFRMWLTNMRKGLWFSWRGPQGGAK